MGWVCAAWEQCAAREQWEQWEPWEPWEPCTVAIWIGL